MHMEELCVDSNRICVLIANNRWLRVFLPDYFGRSADNAAAFNARAFSSIRSKRPC